MIIELDKISNQFALFENYYLNFYNIIFTDESLNNFLEKVKNFFLKSKICMIGISKSQPNISEKQKEMLKNTFTNWNGEFTIIN
jgi:hypothetical protein